MQQTAVNTDTCLAWNLACDPLYLESPSLDRRTGIAEGAVELGDAFYARAKWEALTGGQKGDASW